MREKFDTTQKDCADVVKPERPIRDWLAEHRADFLPDVAVPELFTAEELVVALAILAERPQLGYRGFLRALEDRLARTRGVEPMSREGEKYQQANQAWRMWIYSFGLKVSPRMGEPGDYLIERAFVEK